MAPPNEYATSGGGRLKIKGAKIQDGRVDKKKKKKKDKEKAGAKTEEGAGEKQKLQEHQHGNDEMIIKENEAEEKSREVTESRADNEMVVGGGKTETERKYAEARKKRLNERLKREGVKSHKERVEELNKYLSNLSEHHDMPRIGPG